MPMRDHFHAPWNDENPWEGFHSAWANTIVRQLNGQLLPPRYRAVPQVHFGAWIEADVATFERDGNRPAGQTGETEGAGVSTSIWAPPEPAQTLLIDLPSQDVFEVQVLDESRGSRLVAVVELVSPGNKDRSEHRGPLWPSARLIFNGRSES